MGATPLPADPDLGLLVSVAGRVREDYASADAYWDRSPFAWIRRLSSRQRGAVGERLVAEWCRAHGLDVSRAPDSECDRRIAGLRAETKFSTLWATGVYVFQQFRDQNYDVAVCLGLSPFAAHCWVLSKQDVTEHILGRTPQHAGRRGRDTAWVHIKPDRPQSWLQGKGGSLGEALEVLKNLARTTR